MKRVEILPWVILGISLVITLSLWENFLNSELNIQQMQFEANIIDATQKISDRLARYEQVLIGAKGLFAASEKVELDEWKKFIDVQKIDERFPGIQGVGYAHHITNEERDDFIEELKNFGETDYAIKPEGIRDEYYPVMFLEPQDFRNKKAIGYDIFVEETRHNAIGIVKSTGTTTITGKVMLIQETENDIQNGFLMLVPIYEKKLNGVESFELDGIVFAVFRMNDFVRGIFESGFFENTHMKIYDNGISDENLFFDSNHIIQKRFDEGEFSEIINVEVGNREWKIVFEGVQPPHQGIEQQILVAIPIIGFFVSILLFYFVRVFVENMKFSQESVKSEKMSIIGMMAARIAHDIRNPLTIINVCNENLKLMIGEDKIKQSQVEKISRSVKSISDIIEDVLTFAKNKKINKEKISIKTMLQNVLDEINIPDKIKIHIPKNHVIINCDKSKIESVFSNLISNSIQAIENEGKIAVYIKESPNKILIIFEDSGPGIPEEKLSEIFDVSFTTKQSGTGLGLSICKNIIEQHNGKIYVANNPTRFTLELPKGI